MDSEDEKYLTQQIAEYKKQVLNSIAKDCRDILHEALMETVFSYSPNVYNRTGQLEDINNIEFSIDGDILSVYFNTNNMQYYSFGKGDGNNANLKPVGGDAVIHFLEVGHDSESPYESGLDYFWHYPSRHFLELAQIKIKEKYPELIVQIIRDQPQF